MRPGFLKKAQLPQTAVAAELRYSETERSFAYRRDGGREPLTERATQSPGEYSHLENLLPSPALKEISDYTIVDTAGFDSNVEAHSRALADYIGMGSGYIVVVDGHILENLCRELIDTPYEVTHYSEILGVVLFCLNDRLSEAMELLSGIRSCTNRHSFLFFQSLHKLPQAEAQRRHRDDARDDFQSGFHVATSPTAVFCRTKTNPVVYYTLNLAETQHHIAWRG